MYAAAFYIRKYTNKRSLVGPPAPALVSESCLEYMKGVEKEMNDLVNEKNMISPLQKGVIGITLNPGVSMQEAIDRADELTLNHRIEDRDGYGVYRFLAIPEDVDPFSTADSVWNSRLQQVVLATQENTPKGRNVDVYDTYRFEYPEKKQVAAIWVYLPSTMEESVESAQHVAEKYDLQILEYGISLDYTLKRPAKIYSVRVQAGDEAAWICHLYEHHEDVFLKSNFRRKQMVARHASN